MATGIAETAVKIPEGGARCHRVGEADVNLDGSIVLCPQVYQWGRINILLSF
ncbi:unnamed protein product [Spirodela intermedia]|uniref:Uncharacterized protein n=2 Tax=Spirodela intermedia TaxID=51605 RepID=A0A7I8LD88_SPIIN|nr:unnamed protein product [Spirodela intermedia]CAA6670537.1 unnamed protein product [Spirodela intermedia]CAA7407606.1 unnamed protein product [Spirodela intermedia]